MSSQGSSLSPGGGQTARPRCVQDGLRLSILFFFFFPSVYPDSAGRSILARPDGCGLSIFTSLVSLSLTQSDSFGLSIYLYMCTGRSILVLSVYLYTIFTFQPLRLA